MSNIACTIFQIPKLFQWLIAGIVFLSVWVALVFGYVETELSDSTKDVILFVSFCIQYNKYIYSLLVIRVERGNIICTAKICNIPYILIARLRSTVGNVSGYRCASDCRSRGREFDPGPVPYFRGDWSWNNFYGHFPPFRWFIQEGLLSVTSESMCINYWLIACLSLPRKKCG